MPGTAQEPTPNNDAIKTPKHTTVSHAIDALGLTQAAAFVTSMLPAVRLYEV